MRIINVLALHFVTSVDQLLFEALVPRRMAAMVSNMAIQAWPVTPMWVFDINGLQFNPFRFQISQHEALRSVMFVAMFVKIATSTGSS